MIVSNAEERTVRPSLRVRSVLELTLVAGLAPGGPGREQQLGEDVPRNLAAELLAGVLVGAEVLPRVDAAQRRFVRGGAEARERTLDAGKRGRLRRELEAVAAEEGTE